MQIVRNDEQHRYEGVVDGAVAGFAEYRMAGRRIIFTHTEVDDPEQHHGLGSQIVAAALDDVRARGLSVTARCPFVARYIEEHPEYQDLLARL